MVTTPCGGRRKRRVHRALEQIENWCTASGHWHRTELVLRRSCAVRRHADRGPITVPRRWICVVGGRRSRVVRRVANLEPHRCRSGRRRRMSENWSSTLPMWLTAKNRDDRHRLMQAITAVAAWNGSTWTDNCGGTRCVHQVAGRGLATCFTQLGFSKKHGGWCALAASNSRC